MKVIKRKGAEQDFCLDKIKQAITKANNSVGIEDRMNEEAINKVTATVVKKLEGFNSINVEDIQDFVEQSLVRHNKYAVSKAYILYREEKKKKKKFTENEEKVLCLISGDSDSLRGDNANKHVDDNGAISDYMAGILSKSLFEKLVDSEIVKAHKKGLIHWHDSDYFGRPMHNCDLLNTEDMFANNFQMQNTLIEPNEETPFRTACNLLAQINLIVSGRQYGGQTITWAHVLPYVEFSRQLIAAELRRKYNNEEPVIKTFRKMLNKLNINTGVYNTEKFNEEVEDALKKEIYEGVKTYQYQILCHSSSNGQTPFVSNNLCLREAENQKELDDMALIIEEIFKRRLKGVKDSSGHYISPLFPKLLYWMCEGLNVKEGDPYFYLTELAAKCEAKRMQPDINSEKQCRKIKKGQIIPSMGCRSWLSPIWEENTYDIDTEFYWTENNTTFDDNFYNFTINNMTTDDFEKCAYPYGTFVEKKSFKYCPDGEYPIGFICINFRGNTGWLIKKSAETVTILQPKVYGRFNCGVVTINLPHVGLEAREAEPENMDNRLSKFWELMDSRMELVRKALKIRYKYVRQIKGKNSEILWCHGALSRIKPEETVGELMDRYPSRASISVGFVGLYETCYSLINQSNTTEDGRKLSKKILTYMNDKCNEWKKTGDYIEFNSSDKLEIINDDEEFEIDE